MEDKETFYGQVKAIMDKVPKCDLKILMGDMNAKVEADKTNRELIMASDNRMRMVNFSQSSAPSVTWLLKIEKELA